jgi:ataxin-3
MLTILSSMLCAQHALNSLLQGNFFTPPDLSEIARDLDAIEESYDDENPGTRSGNMDDSVLRVSYGSP